jgi:lactoylglutathione lyase
MQYLHTMVRVTNVDESLRFYCEGLGLEEVRRSENEKGRYTLIFLRAPGDVCGEVELTYNWDPEEYTGGRNFGHLAYRVKDIYALCQHLSDMGVVINRPPRDGHMAFVRSPDGHLGRADPGRHPAPAGAMGVDAEHRKVVAHSYPWRDHH